MLILQWKIQPGVVLQRMRALQKTGLNSETRNNYFKPKQRSTTLHEAKTGKQECGKWTAAFLSCSSFASLVPTCLSVVSPESIMNHKLKRLKLHFQIHYAFGIWILWMKFILWILFYCTIFFLFCVVNWRYIGLPKIHPSFWFLLDVIIKLVTVSSTVQNFS